MGSLNLSTSLENEVETVAGRTRSSTESESELFLHQKTPFISIQDIDQLDALIEDDCPYSWQRPFWKGTSWKINSSACKHGRRSIKEYIDTTSPVRTRPRTRPCTIFLGILTFCFALFGMYNVLTILIGLGPLLWDPDLDQFFLNWGQPGQPGEGMSGYPTDFTRDILPIPCHSHNDYWRKIPLFSAIHYGCTGIEADVWLFPGNDELLVGHNTAALSKNRTFRSLYVDPLVRILDDQNSINEFDKPAKQPHGVFDEDPLHTLVLLVDFKTDGQALFPYVEAQLSALRDKNYLTYFDGKTVLKGAVTVVGTGNAPFQLLTANTTYRDIFFDAPLDKLMHPKTPLTGPPGGGIAGAAVAGGGQGVVGVTPSTEFNRENSYYASVNFGRTIGFPWRGHFSSRQRHLLRAQIKAAHERGLKARYWNTPAWPIGLRNHVWSILAQEGADMLNVDDLRGASKLDWRRRKDRD